MNIQTIKDKILHVDKKRITGAVIYYWPLSVSAP